MIPSGGGPVLGGSVGTARAAELPSATYRIDFAAGRITGRVDGQAAMRQAIHKILQTKRFAWNIYSWNYGNELDGVLGKSFRVVESEIGRLLREALLQDGRITQLRDLTVARVGPRTVKVCFTAVTVFGELREEAEVYA